jgi:hypothetical protein
MRTTTAQQEEEAKHRRRRRRRPSSSSSSSSRKRRRRRRPSSSSSSSRRRRRRRPSSSSSSSSRHGTGVLINLVQAPLACGCKRAALVLQLLVKLEGAAAVPRVVEQLLARYPQLRQHSSKQQEGVGVKVLIHLAQAQVLLLVWLGACM